jgi:large subunit ribosomal protein L1
MELEEAIEKAKTESKQRNFVQSIDLFINLKNVDLSKQENKINLELFLPKGRGKDRKVALIAGDELAASSKGKVDRIISKQELEKLDKKKAKKLANEFHFFISETSLMPVVGRFMGQALGPRGKMPKPVPPNANVEPLVKRLKNTVLVKTKGKDLPVLHCAIGTENMDREDLKVNAETVLNALKEKLPQREQNVKSIMVKTTMGPVVRVGEETE